MQGTRTYGRVPVKRPSCRPPTPSNGGAHSRQARVRIGHSQADDAACQIATRTDRRVPGKLISALSKGFGRLVGWFVGCTCMRPCVYGVNVVRGAKAPRATVGTSAPRSAELSVWVCREALCSPCNGRAVASAPPHRDRFKRAISPCNGRPVASAPPHRDRFKRDKCADPRSHVSALCGYVEKHDAPRATVGRSLRHPRPRSVQKR